MVKAALFLSLILLTSCVYDHTDSIIELGNNYYFVADGNESEILLNISKSSGHKVGRIITGKEVVEYNFDEKYIIAKSINDGVEKFWFIEKQIDLDSIRSLSLNDFYSKIEEMNIEMPLKKRD